MSNPLSHVPRAPCNIDSLKGLPFIPKKPLPAKSFAMYIVGHPGSGKTNLWNSMMISKSPLYYRGFFHHVDLISGSLGTISEKVLKHLPKDQQHHALSDDLMNHLIDSLRYGSGKNGNNLLILDDVIKDIKASKELSKVFLNRRHCTHDPNRKGQAGLSIMVTSQKYSLLPLEFRGACDHIILFRTANASEIKKIRDELMQDLDRHTQLQVLKIAWARPYSFLMIRANASTEERYFVKFDRIVIT